MYKDNKRKEFQRFTFKKGEGVITLPKRDFLQILGDAFDNFLYTLVRTERNRNQDYEDRRIKTYHKNVVFWQETLLNYNHIGQRIRLKNFSVIEWLPSSPGLFFTGKAENSRRKAEQSFNFDRNEFLPLGKLEMVLGGIGSVRLGSDTIGRNTNRYYMCATSSGASHEGIPLILDGRLYSTIIDEVKSKGYCKGELTGTIQILQTEKSIITYDREVPKYCLVVDDIKKWNDTADDILVTIAVAFQCEDDRDYGFNRNTEKTEFKWTFCTFEPNRGDDNLIKSVDWLRDYTERYCGDPKIISDFDEHRNHFTDVEFSIRNIMSNETNRARISEYAHNYQFNINKVVMGDNFENISGTIINRSIVSNSFNKVREQIDEEAAQLLQHITEEVERSGDKEAVEIMESFHEEIQKPEPKKSLLKTFWNGVVTAVPALITNADKVLDIIEKVGKVLPH